MNKIPIESYPGELFGLESERVNIATGTTWVGNYGMNLNWNVIDMQHSQHDDIRKDERYIHY